MDGLERINSLLELEVIIWKLSLMMPNGHAPRSVYQRIARLYVVMWWMDQVVCGSDGRKQYPLLSLTKLFLDVLLRSGSKGTERRTVTRLLSAADRIKGGDGKSK